MNRFFLIILTIVSLPVVSCIRNDIPYPEIDAAITSLDADGAKSVSISTDIHEVVLTLEETVDISKVNIREVSFNDEAVAASFAVLTKDAKVEDNRVVPFVPAAPIADAATRERAALMKANDHNAWRTASTAA